MDKKLYDFNKSAVLALQFSESRAKMLAMNIKGKKVLVTGADGFIGSHLVEALVAYGCNVCAFVYYNSFNSWGWLDHSPVKDKVEIFSGDVRDPFGVKKAMEGCEVVFHLAALIAIPYSYHSPASYIDTNVTGTLNIVQAARELGVKKVIHTSTSEVYGTAQFVPITEEHPLQGQSPYSASKIGADQIAWSYYSSFNTPVVVLRPFNTYGPRQSARAVIPTIITQLLQGDTKVKLGSLHPTRDFSYVGDTARGFIAAAESEAVVGKTINLGAGYEISIQDTAKLIAEVIGSKIDIISDDQRLRPENSEVERLLSDNTKAREVMGWKPEFEGVEGFKKGIEKTVEWFRDPKNLAAYKSNIYNI